MLLLVMAAELDQIARGLGQIGQRAAIAVVDDARYASTSSSARPREHAAARRGMAAPSAS
jgi:hypothetical protein